MSEEISLVCNSLFVSPRPTERGPIIAEMRALAVTCIHQYPLRVPAGEFLDLPTKYCTVHMYGTVSTVAIPYNTLQAIFSVGGTTDGRTIESLFWLDDIPLLALSGVKTFLCWFSTLTVHWKLARQCCT